jgi:hypothetical protein
MFEDGGSAVQVGNTYTGWNTGGVGEINQMTFTAGTGSTADKFTINNSEDGVYKIDAVFNLECDTNNTDVYFSTFVNGLQIAVTEVYRTFDSGGVGSFTMMDLIDLNGGDTVELRWRTNSATAQITPINISFNLIKLVGNGVQGTQGTQGTQGLGSQGTQGSIGAQGVQGTNGTQGANGTQGTQGSIGAQGTNGTQGANGTQGTIGAQGTDGSQGTQGLQGTDGSQGTQGLQGTDGSQGTQGLQGTDGSQGTQGVQGTDGSQGVAGDQGVQGTTGSQGTQGTDGSQGVAGDQGVQGTTGSQGTQGTQGLQGTDGSQGVAGDQGVQGTTGSQGVQGTTGSQGVRGPQGTTGSQGVQGTGGSQGVTGSGADGSNSLRWLYNGTTAGAPLADTFRLNNGNLTLVTQVRIAYTEENGTDVQDWLSGISVGDHLGIYEIGNTSEFVIGEITAVADTGTYWIMNITSIAANGSANLAGSYAISYSQIGAQGTTGPQGTTGLQGTIGTSIQGTQGTAGGGGEATEIPIAESAWYSKAGVPNISAGMQAGSGAPASGGWNTQAFGSKVVDISTSSTMDPIWSHNLIVLAKDVPDTANFKIRITAIHPGTTGVVPNMHVGLFKWVCGTYDSSNDLQLQLIGTVQTTGTWTNQADNHWYWCGDLTFNPSTLTTAATDRLVVGFASVGATAIENTTFQCSWKLWAE